MKQLILGSSSPFRRAILDKLQLNYSCHSPDIDESPLANEPPEQLVARLSLQKAEKVAQEYSDALIIGSDQVAIINDEVLGKPGNHENATRQLSKLSGNKVTFLTALTLLNSETGNSQTEVVPFYVYFRELTPAMIENYLRAEQPYNCAGSFKSEALGIVLFDKLEGEDPNTLIGMPLIRLVRMLEAEGLAVL